MQLLFYKIEKKATEPQANDYNINVESRGNDKTERDFENDLNKA